MAVELEIQVRPLWTEQEHHHEIHQEVEHQDGTGDDPDPLQRIDRARDDDRKRQKAEPDDQSDDQEAIDIEFESCVLDEVHLSEFVEDEDEDQQSVGQEQPPGPGLEGVGGVRGERVDFLLDLMHERGVCVCSGKSMILWCLCY